MSDGQTQACESIQQQNAIDWTKPVEYRYWVDDAERFYPVVSSVENPTGDKLCVIRRPNGFHFPVHFNEQTAQLFRNVRRKVKMQRWLNLYRDGIGGSYNTKEHADRIAKECRLECRLIEWEVPDDE